LTDVTFSKNLTDIHVSDVGIQVFPGIWYCTAPVERMRKKLSVATSEISEFSQTQNIYV